MIFETVAAVTAALSALNGLISQVKETGGNVNSVLDRMTGIQDGMNKLEIEKRESISQPLTPQEAMKLAWAKQSIDRYNESRERHAANIKAILAKKKARKQFLQDLFLYSTVGIIGLMIAAIVITLVIFAFRP